MPLFYLPLRASPKHGKSQPLILSTAKKGDIWYATVTDEEGALVACGFSTARKAAERSVRGSLPKTLTQDIVHSSASPHLIDALHKIYSGERCDRLPATALLSTSKFLRKTYELTMRIPKGKVTTYGRLAQSAGSRGLSRAVGNAMANNPLPLIVPCHRVVPSTLRVGNYGGAGSTAGSRTKRALLIREGVKFDGEKILESCVWDPTGAR